MRLIQTDGQGNMTGEVKTFDPISTVEDAARIAAQHGGDGTYWADTGDGKFYEFVIEGGRAENMTDEGWRSGNPGEQVDNAEMADRVQRPASEFGGFFLDPDQTAESANFLMPAERPAPPAPAEEPVAEEAPAEDAAAEGDEAPAAEEGPVEEAVAEGDETEGEETPTEGEEVEGDASEAAPAEGAE